MKLWTDSTTHLVRNKLPTSKAQWSFIKKQNGKERECLVIDKLVDGEREVENELDIANCLKN